MDTPTYTPNPSGAFPLPPASPPRLTHTSNAKGIIIGGFALAVFAALLVFGLPYLQHKASPIAKPFLFAAGIFPGSALYVADPGTSTSTPLTVTVEGKTLHALDAQRASDGTWYFILNEGGISNLYKKATDGTITHLTSSATAKYNLSLDQASGRLAYQALVPPTDGSPSFLLRQDWNVTIFDPKDSKEMVAATGTDPFFVPGGNQLLLRKGNSLVLQAVGQKSSATVLTLPSAVYAIEPNAKMVTVYNPVTKNLDQYALTHGFSPNYVSSTILKDAPSALGYVNGQLIATFATRTKSQSTFVFMPVGASAGSIFVPAITNGAPQRLYSYE